MNSYTIEPSRDMRDTQHRGYERGPGDMGTGRQSWEKAFGGDDRFFFGSGDRSNNEEVDNHASDRSRSATIITPYPGLLFAIRIVYRDLLHICSALVRLWTKAR